MPYNPLTQRAVPFFVRFVQNRQALVWWVFSIFIGSFSLYTLLQVNNRSKANAAEISLPTQGQFSPVLLIFIDSLSDRIATDESVMPTVANLRNQGASFTVEPCKDRLTYLCLAAIFRGTDESSLFSLYKNFDHKQMQQQNYFDKVAHLRFHHFTLQAV